MPTEIELLRSLDPEPPAPSTIDISRAIAAGRKRRRRQGAGYAGVAAVTALVVAGVAVAVSASGTNRKATPVAGPTHSGSPSAPASAKPKGTFTIPGTPGWTAPAATPPTSCAIEKLAVPDKVKMALISGADPTGHYLVGRSYPKDGYQAVIWHDGTPTKVNLPGDLEESLGDVNSAGTAVGWSYTDTDGITGPVPYAYASGKVVKLKGVARGSANAVNDAGAIAGDDGSHAIVWPSPTATAIKLPTPEGTDNAAAVAIDEDGTVVGNLDLKVPFAWFADGTSQALPLPTYQGKKVPSARVFAIRNGWAIGVADRVATAQPGAGSAKDLLPVTWNLRTGRAQITGDWEMSAEDVNAQGWQIGISKGRAALVAGGHKVALPELSHHEAGQLTNIPNAISDDGRLIAGQSDDAGGTIHAVVWRCR